MKRIHKFQEGRLYSTLSNNNWYEPIQRDGKHIVFKVRTAGTGNTWNQEADVTYVADGNGAYETVRFSDGIVVKADVSTTHGKKLSEVSPELCEAIIKTIEEKSINH